MGCIQDMERNVFMLATKSQAHGTVDLSSFSSDDIDVRERLKRLLDVISDVTELNTASNLDGLKIVELLNGLCSSINGMVSSFVKVLHTPISYSLLLDIVDM
ncbi:hypothetical protein Gotur_004566 [Gossypium turneri]